MTYNPLSQLAEDAAEQVVDGKEKVAKLQRELGRHGRFKPAAANATISVLTSSVTATRERLKPLEQRYAREQRSAVKLTPEGVGWAFWKLFSSEHSAAKKSHQQQVDVADAARAERDQARAELKALTAKLRKTEKDLARHQSTDPEALKAQLRELEAEVALLVIEADDLRARAAEVDQLLAEPLAELHDRTAELRDLRNDLHHARSLDRELDSAANSYERKLIHDRCADHYETSSPREVIRQLERSVDSVERTISKLDRRLTDIGRRSARPVHAVIVDGSNACFEGSTFIAFAALAPLVRQLATNHAVTVVFDASIRQRMHMNTDTIYAQLPGVKVHIVAGRRKADETILDLADDEYVFIVSNDRFSEFREKPAVREQRLIRHEIVNGRVMLHDLNINLEFQHH